MTSRARALGIALLLVILGVGSVRLAAHVRPLVRHGLQADFSAYYTAGESLNRGLSPYQNYAAQDASLWDGVDLWQPSRFLYPPLAAVPFRALAALPYGPAKATWTLVSCLLAVAALLLAARLTGGRATVPCLLAGVWLVWGWPLLLELERGQVDLCTLVLVLGATVVERRSGRGPALLAGALWALAVVFKLHVVLVLPFLLLRRRFDVVAGTLLAGAALLVVSAVAMPGATYAYLAEALPRMVRHGINPPPGSQLAPAVLRSLFAGYPPVVAHAHDGVYLRFAVAFDDHASLVWALAGEQASYPGLLSLLVAGVMVGAVALVVRRRAGKADAAPDAHLAWLVLALCCVLLAAPLTWPMNAVWLLPAVCVVAGQLAHRSEGALGYAGVTLGLVGLVLVAVPDRFAWPWPGSLQWLSRHKYVLGELAVAGAMLARLAAARAPAVAPAVVPGDG